MTADGEVVDAALARLERGDGSALAAARAALAEMPPGPASAAWTLAVDAADWFWRGVETRPPRPEAVAALAAYSGTHRASRQVCAVMERAAVLDFDPGALDRWTAAHRAVGASEVELALAACWAEVLAGSAPVAAAEAARAAASREALAPAVVEATALGALALLAAGDVPRALVLGRRAALMARSEGLPRQELLAALLLARLRRHAGRPHLSVRIVSLLAGSLPWPWRGWAAWELALAQGRWDPETLAPAGRAGDAAVKLRAVLDAAMAGDEAFEAAATALHEATRGCALLAAEADAALAALDPLRPAPAALASWRRGDSAQFPATLGGLGGLGPPAGSRACVVAPTAAAGTRVLPAGIALFQRRHGPAVPIPDGEEERTLAGIAALVLAGPEGQPVADFFRRVYGFGFVPHLHGGTLRVLLFRVRKALADLATVTVADRQIAARTAAPLVVPDPRCAEPPEARIVSYLAFTGAVSTELAAERLRLPVRTTRALLSRLVDAGVCRAVREGRHVSYQVDDTIFTQMTRMSGLD